MKLKSLIAIAALVVSGSVFAVTSSPVSIPNITISKNSVTTVDMSQYLTPTFVYSLSCNVQDMTNPESKDTTFDISSNIYGTGPTLEFAFNGTETNSNQFLLDPTKNPNTVEVTYGVTSQLNQMAFGNSDRTDTVLLSNCIATPVHNNK